MPIQISTLTFDFNGQANCILKSIPDTCPKCGCGIIPKVLSGVFVKRENRILEASFCCVREECHEVFIGRYLITPNGYYELLESFPQNFRGEEFSTEILTVSSSFAEIYNQALAAESMQLSEIAGVGFRKSLEFLIKDYLCCLTPESADEIKAAPLGRCINERISDINIREITRRAVWVGNDETHYVRKWENKDISDLKILIRIASNFIENERKATKYLQEMSG